MKLPLIALWLVASVSAAQGPAPAAPAPSPQTPASAITVSPGTTVALTLLSPIKSKSTRPGDAVRAVDSVPTRAPHTHMPAVKIHFTTLLFANGYSLSLDAINTEAKSLVPAIIFKPAFEIADARAGAPYLGDAFLAPGQNPPALPPLPSNGPSPAVIAGVSMGATAAVMALSFALARHGRGNADEILFDNGWQFQMVLEHPLTIEPGKIPAAAGAPAMP